MKKRMSEDAILKILRTKGPMSGADLARRLNVSRQAVNKRIHALVDTGKIAQSGATRNSAYSIFGKQKVSLRWSRSLQLKGLDEETVFSTADAFLRLSVVLSSRAFSIIRFAFTELLNNAIDHSKGNRCEVVIEIDQSFCRFKIRDHGIGVFRSIKDKFKLNTEEDAALELLKGKRTTWAERHTGQGIFFSARSGEQVLFRSHRLALAFDNRSHEISLSDVKPQVRGTEVKFQILRYSSRDLRKLFDNFAPEEFDFKFDKTEVRIGLFSDAPVSRSEARRMLFGLDKFRRISLNFNKVHSMGQGFADEVFRIFLENHPSISIDVISASPAVKAMIIGAIDKKNIDRLTIN